MRRFKADLHIHTALSPCSSAEMTPPAIVEAAIRRGLDMIAICDHNAAENVAPAQEAAGDNLAVLAGIEITTEEDIHVLGLFPDAASACAAGCEVKETLPDVAGAARVLGEQLRMSATGDVVGVEPKMLSASSGLDLGKTVALVKRHGGLAVAAHVDRPSFSVTSQLGFFPDDVQFDGIEISANGAVAGRQKEYEGLGLPMLVSSDAHFLSDVGNGFTKFHMLAPTFDEIVLALQRQKGRGGVHA
ncbi:MAG: PHP-associated domain-containing protein [Planctomycetota bacterium]